MPICTRYPSHVYPEHNGTCPYCARDAEARAARLEGSWGGILDGDLSGTGEPRPIGLPAGVWSPIPSGVDPMLSVVLLVDVSAAMASYVADLERGVKTFIDDIQGDSLARKRTEIAVVTFDFEAALRVPFQAARSIAPLSFLTGDTSNLTAGIHLALNVLDARRAQLRASSLEYFRPWLFVITAGTPDVTGLEEAMQRLHEAEERKHVTVVAVSVADRTDPDVHDRLSRQLAAVPLNGEEFSSPLAGALLSDNWGYDDAPIFDSIDLTAGTADEKHHITLPRPEGWAVL